MCLEVDEIFYDENIFPNGLSEKGQIALTNLFTYARRISYSKYAKDIYESHKVFKHLEIKSYEDFKEYNELFEKSLDNTDEGKVNKVLIKILKGSEINNNELFLFNNFISSPYFNKMEKELLSQSSYFIKVKKVVLDIIGFSDRYSHIMSLDTGIKGYEELKKEITNAKGDISEEFIEKLINRANVLKIIE